MLTPVTSSAVLYLDHPNLSGGDLGHPAGAKVIEDEVKIAEEKFQESKELAETAMINFLSSDPSLDREPRRVGPNPGGEERKSEQHGGEGLLRR
ncbi:unnamed protein product [Dibothriocephalus latus]|uniref:Uncharacterized protein n=1 Tax=Dibothriocephalus latus TaxID=60516 RepID=A0A3P6VFD1_DIBLA|nr:unnamed protein product [Dibothriocephalus latus]